MATKTTKIALSDVWHTDAEELGLRHVDGWGSRSVFEGDLDAWGAFAKRLGGTIAVAEVSRGQGAKLRSARAALVRANAALATLLADECTAAFEAGRGAYGKHVAPAQDPIAMDLVGRFPQASTILLGEWLRGFHLAHSKATKAVSDDVAAAAKAVRS